MKQGNARSPQEPWFASMLVLDELVPGLQEAGALCKALQSFRMAFSSSSFRAVGGRAVSTIDDTEAIAESWNVLRVLADNMCDPLLASSWKVMSDSACVQSYKVPEELLKACTPMLFGFAAGAEQTLKLEVGTIGRLRISLHGARKVVLLDGQRFAEKFLKKADAGGAEVQKMANALSDDDIKAIMALDPSMLQTVLEGCESSKFQPRVALKSRKVSKIEKTPLHPESSPVSLFRPL